MGLITCPDCGKEISDAAPACIQCGRPMQGLPQRITAPQRRDMAEHVEKVPESPGLGSCAHCGSTDVKLCSYVYSAGLSLSSSSTEMVGIGIGGSGALGLGLASASRDGMSQTHLSMVAEPPPTALVIPMRYWRTVGCGLILPFLVGVITTNGPMFAFACVIGVPVGLILDTAKNNESKRKNAEMEAFWQQRREEWEDSVICMRCGKKTDVLDRQLRTVEDELAMDEAQVAEAQWAAELANQRLIATEDLLEHVSSQPTEVDTCPACEASNPSGWRYCQECGAARRG